MRRWAQAGLTGCIMGLLLLLGLLPWMRLNLSPSVPRGVYWLHAVPATLTYGQLIVFPVPEGLARWHPGWMPFLKPVAGLPGDTACINSNGYTINGEAYGPVHTKAGGFPLPQLRGCFLVAPDEVLTASKHTHSLDSRYFSGIHLSQIRAVATPLWTW